LRHKWQKISSMVGKTALSRPPWTLVHNW